ncbi:MAG: hypothetical protein GY839_15090, partial [candidate division Zixibacteria bacterium]|nr:hypothetical protein [candidate division Zixibacteria bacterium]
MKFAKKLSLLVVVVCLGLSTTLIARNNPELARTSGGGSDSPLTLDVENVICSVGTVHNLISNSTHERATGTNDWTILIGDDSGADPSMIWTTPEEYADYNHYLYFASLRIGYHGHQIMLAEDSSPG